MTTTTKTATKTVSKATRMANLAIRFVKIKALVEKIDGTLVEYFDDKIAELETFSVELAEHTAPNTSDEPRN